MLVKSWQLRQRIQSIYTAALILAVLLAVVWASWWVGQASESLAQRFSFLALGGLLAVVIWFYPYLGLVLIAASLPLQDILPHIPYATSLLSALGALTLGAFLAGRKGKGYFHYRLPLQFVLAIGFIIWQFVSYPNSSFYGARNWLWTYLQLLIILVLASELLDFRRQRILMVLFIVAACVSAVAAFSEANFATEFSSAAGLVRGRGYGDDQNNLALYLVLAVVFTAYIQRETRSAWVVLACGAAELVLLLGVVGTVSRAGFLTAGLGLALIAVFFMAGGRKKLWLLGLMAVGLVIAVLFFIPPTYWDLMQRTIFSPEREQATNFGTRGALIEAGLHIWRDHPATRVGIGQFRVISEDYLLSIDPDARGLVAHNFYVSLLAETGLVGFLLFIGWIVVSIYQLLVVAFSDSRKYAPLAAAWLIAFALNLFKGYTASTMHYDKLLWMMGGLTIPIYYGMLRERRAAARQAEAAHE